MYYATRIQAITAASTEHQLLKFYAKKDRDTYVREIGGAAITAREANKLMIADVSRAHSGYGMVFFVSRYIP